MQYPNYNNYRLVELVLTPIVVYPIMGMSFFENVRYL